MKTMKTMILWQIGNVLLVAVMFKSSLAYGLSYMESIDIAAVVTLLAIGAIFGKITKVLPHRKADPFLITEARPKLCALAAVSFTAATVFTWDVIHTQAIGGLIASLFGIFAVFTAKELVETSTDDKKTLRSKFLVAGICMVLQVVALYFILKSPT